MANREHDVPNKLNTKFRLGSLTKQFTAMAVMILIEREKLRVTDPLCKYIENCPKAWASVTIRHLLNHTSGIPAFTDFPEIDHYEHLPMTPLATIARFRDKPLEFVPGERFSYDDSGYLLLGYIVERASGERYEDFLRTNIYEPLGMADSGYDHPWVILKDRASGYERKDGQTVNAMLMQMDTPLGGGSMYSTVGTCFFGIRHYTRTSWFRGSPSIKCSRPMRDPIPPFAGGNRDSIPDIDTVMDSLLRNGLDATSSGTMARSTASARPSCDIPRTGRWSSCWKTGTRKDKARPI